ncbi:hypothetical protein, partial [Mycoplasma sp. SG1]|uniref:hypothetical protein n=1 Tax=Mycoplasma sp. SG1 TaxID=2810348 RepID=UPI002024646B
MKSFIRGFQGPFFAFIFPLISLFIIGSIISWFPGPSDDEILNLAFLNVAPGTIALVIVSLGISSFPQIILRYKETIIIKRLGVTPFTKTNF